MPLVYVWTQLCNCFKCEHDDYVTVPSVNKTLIIELYWERKYFNILINFQ